MGGRVGRRGRSGVFVESCLEIDVRIANRLFKGINYGGRLELGDAFVSNSYLRN